MSLILRSQVFSYRPVSMRASCSVMVLAPLPMGKLRFSVSFTTALRME